MNFKEVFKDALIYPFTGANFVTLFLLILGSILIIPIFIARGYELRIIERTIQGSCDLPDFKDSGNLITQGLKYIAAGIIYGIPTYILMIAFIISGNSDFTTNGTYLITSAIIGFVISIIFILSLANMVVEDRFGAVFDFKKVIGLIRNMGWGKYISYLVLYAIITQILSLIVLVFYSYLIISLGFLAGFISYYLIAAVFGAYLAMFGGRFRGLIYSEAMEGQEMEIQDNGE